MTQEQKDRRKELKQQREQAEAKYNWWLETATVNELLDGLTKTCLGIAFIGVQYTNGGETIPCRVYGHPFARYTAQTHLNHHAFVTCKDSTSNLVMYSAYPSREIIMALGKRCLYMAISIIEQDGHITLKGKNAWLTFSDLRACFDKRKMRNCRKVVRYEKTFANHRWRPHLF